MLVYGTATTAALAEGRWQQIENKANCAVWNSNPSANDKVTWTGDCVNGRADGYGKQTWRTLRDGEWEEQIYTGMKLDGKAHGRGVALWAYGNSYEGDWKDGKRHGRGIYTDENGNKYEGEFRNGWEDGRGVLVLANGDRYDGDWKDGKRHGRGIFVFADGIECEGDWREQKLLGTGEARWKGEIKKCYWDGGQIRFKD